MLDRILNATSNIAEPTKKQETGKQLYDFVKQKIENYKKEIDSKSEHEDTTKLRNECEQLYRFSNRDFFDEILIPTVPTTPPSIGNIPPPQPQQVPSIENIPPPPVQISTKIEVKANIKDVKISEIQQVRQMLERDTQEKVEERNGRNDD